MKTLQILLYNVFFFFFLVGFILANREDPDVTVDRSMVNEAENDTNLNKVNTDKAWELIQQGEYELSKDILVNLEDNTKSPEVLNLLGYVERQLQNFNQSIEYYKNALILDPDYIPAHHYIAMTYLEMDELESAKSHFYKIDLLCLFGCEEFFELKDAIAMYEENNG